MTIAAWQKKELACLGHSSLLYIVMQCDESRAQEYVLFGQKTLNFAWWFCTIWYAVQHCGGGVMPKAIGFDPKHVFCIAKDGRAAVSVTNPRQSIKFEQALQLSFIGHNLIHAVVLYHRQ